MTTQPPPGTGGTTLVEELLAAAIDNEFLGTHLRNRGFDNEASQVNSRAARLRARAARVRELREKAGGANCDPLRSRDDALRANAAVEAMRALTGPLSPTEPAATPAAPEPIKMSLTMAPDVAEELFGPLVTCDAIQGERPHIPVETCINPKPHAAAATPTEKGGAR